jgi:hypothetical protein
MSRKKTLLNFGMSYSYNYIELYYIFKLLLVIHDIILEYYYLVRNIYIKKNLQN